jgi:hypothetical protein
MSVYMPWEIHAVSEERRTPARENTTETLSCTDSPVSLNVALVEPGVDLATAFD